jgi:hypothetical protein
MSEVVNSNVVHIGHIGTDDQARDIFAKAFTDLAELIVLCSLVGVYQNSILRSRSHLGFSLCLTSRTQ